MRYLRLYGNVPSLVGGEGYRGLQRKLGCFVLLSNIRMRYATSSFARRYISGAIFGLREMATNRGVGTSQVRFSRAAESDLLNGPFERSSNTTTPQRWESPRLGSTLTTAPIYQQNVGNIADPSPAPFPTAIVRIRWGTKSDPASHQVVTRARQGATRAV